MSTVASAGTIMFLAGEKRTAAPNAFFQFHHVTQNFSKPPTSMTLDEFADRKTSVAMNLVWPCSPAEAGRNSSGPPDYCGPYTQQATLVAIDFLRRQPFVRPDKVALFGYSRGAIVAAMVATLDPKLAAVVLGAGAYDFFTWRPTLPGISRNLFAEAGMSAEAFMARSAIYHVQHSRSGHPYCSSMGQPMNEFRFSRPKPLLRN